jgi:hypothetical protein
MREPIDFAGAFLVEHADIAPELTIAQWRQARARQRRAAREHARRGSGAARRRARLRALLTVAHGARPVRPGLPGAVARASRRAGGSGSDSVRSRTRSISASSRGEPRVAAAQVEQHPDQGIRRCGAVTGAEKRKGVGSAGPLPVTATATAAMPIRPRYGSAGPSP